MNVAIVCPFDIIRSGLCEQVRRLFPDWGIQAFRQCSEITSDELRALGCCLVWHTDAGLAALAQRGKILLSITDEVPDTRHPSVAVYETGESLQQKISEITESIPNDIVKPKNTGISAREKEIICLVAQGKTNREIADELFISTHTVITHRKNITQKLGIKTIAGLTMYALMQNLIPADGQIIRI